MHEESKKVILFMDGCICFQMYIYLCGQHFAKAGIEVLYDTSWFEEDGKDWDGRFERKLELSKLFPDLPFQTVAKEDVAYYRQFKWVGEDGQLLPSVDAIQGTVYLDNCYRMDEGEYLHLFRQYFALGQMTKGVPELDDMVREFEEFEGSKVEKGGEGLREIACAVHVRRGDLAHRETERYKMVSAEYFISAIHYVQQRYGDKAHYYFFSEEQDWVEEHVCRHVEVPYTLVKGYAAYEDLAMIAQADVIVASQGSFGIVGAMLKQDCELVAPMMVYGETRFDVKKVMYIASV